MAILSKINLQLIKNLLQMFYTALKITYCVPYILGKWYWDIIKLMHLIVQVYNSFKFESLKKNQVKKKKK